MRQLGNNERWYVLALVLMGCALRVPVLFNASAIELDGIGYAGMAEQFVRGRFGQGFNNVFPPVYPLFVALFHLAVADVELAGRIVSVVFGTLLIYVSYLFSKEVLKNGTKALGVAFLVAVHPYLIRYSGQVLSESVAACLFTATVFCFYTGWQENRKGRVFLSGLFLTLTYLTRPEYLVFYAPFALLLLGKRRVKDIVLLVLPFLILGALYIGYLRVETGLWIVSKKATLSPFVPPASFFTNAPQVIYGFFVATFPLFFLFGVFGFNRVAKPYRNLFVFLVAFHIVSLSFISHSTLRYSVEFIPVSMIVVIEGIYMVAEYCRRFLSRQLVACAMAGIFILASLFEAFTPARADRALHKEAGLFLLQYDPGSTVASRLPIVCFYEKGTCVNLLSELPEKIDVEKFLTALCQRQVRYLAVDEQTEEEFPFLKEHLRKLVPLKEFREGDSFMRIYRLGCI